MEYWNLEVVHSDGFLPKDIVEHIVTPYLFLKCEKCSTYLTNHRAKKVSKHKFSRSLCEHCTLFDSYTYGIGDERDAHIFDEKITPTYDLQMDYDYYVNNDEYDGYDNFDREGCLFHLQNRCKCVEEIKLKWPMWKCFENDSYLHQWKLEEKYRERERRGRIYYYGKMGVLVGLVMYKIGKDIIYKSSKKRKRIEE